MCLQRLIVPRRCGKRRPRLIDRDIRDDARLCILDRQLSELPLHCFTKTFAREQQFPTERPCILTAMSLFLCRIAVHRLSDLRPFLRLMLRDRVNVCRLHHPARQKSRQRQAKCHAHFIHMILL